MDASVLRNRLRDVVRPRPDATTETRVMSGALSVASDGAMASAEATLGGEWRETTNGRSFIVTTRFGEDEPYGARRVGDFAADIGRAMPAARLIGAGSAQAPFLFFDLETTGLSGGAGTTAFLVGAGWFDAAGGFVVEQHVLTTHAGERDLLRMVAAQFERAGALVSFNGKSFDAPVLETRYLFHRLASPCTALPHVDLLHPARRFWRQASDVPCSLVALERQVLRIRRVGDVPGFEIPARYFQFVRTGDARPLTGVLVHNRLDLLSLAGLTARILHLIETGPAAAATAHEAVALGHVYERAGLTERAEQAYERAIILGAEGDLQPDDGLLSGALRSLAIIARRRRRYEAAAAYWRRLLALPGCSEASAREALEALAIHHEHRVRDLETARLFALKGLECEVKPAWGDAVRHRLARIERKLLSERPSLFPSSTLPPSFDFPMSVRRTSS